MPIIQGHSFNLKQIEQILSASQSSEVTLSLWNKFQSRSHAAVAAILTQLQSACDDMPEEAAKKIERFYALMPMVKPQDRHHFSVQISQPTAYQDGFKWTASLSVSGEVVGKVEIVENASLDSYRAICASKAIAVISSHLNLPEKEAQEYIHDLCMRVGSFSDRENILSIFHHFFDKYAGAIMNDPMTSKVAEDTATLLMNNEVIAPLPVTEELPRITKQDMRPGDILLLMDEPENTAFSHKIIKTGQTLSGLSILRNNCGDSNLVHAVMWVKNPNNPAQTESQGVGEPEVSEFRGAPYLCAQNTALRKGHYIVYRPKNPKLAETAAQIAMVWANERDIKYNKKMAGKSVVRSSTFSDAAVKKVTQYGRDAFKSSPGWQLKGGFCSQFVLAAMQAAHWQIEQDMPNKSEMPAALKLNAKNTTVRTLEHFLKRDSGEFTRLGEIFIEPEQVLYND